MISPQLSSFTGWSALINGGVAALGAVLLALFFVKGEPFGTLNDLTSLPWVITFLPILWLFFRLGIDGHRNASILAAVAGLGGLIGVFVLQTLLVLKVITALQQTYFITSAFGCIGVWILIASQIGRQEAFLSQPLAIFGIVLGIGWLLGMLCVWIGGFPALDNSSAMTDMSNFSYLTIAGLALLFLGYFVQPIWSFWLGFFLRSGE